MLFSDVAQASVQHPPLRPARVASLIRPPFANTSSDACATVSTIVAQNPESFIPALTALDCLKSAPVNVNRSVAFIDFIQPYLEFQSTLAYLKTPPPGWLFPGVDIFGGLAQMKDLLTSGQYANQWDFEKDIYSLINILPHDFHVNLPLPLVSEVFIFAPLTGPLVSISSDGLSLPKVFFKRDLDRSLLNATFTPSALSTVNGEDINIYLQRTAQTLSAYNDPDSTYNTLFFSLPFTVSGVASTFDFGQTFGFDSNSNNYTFENGTTSSFDNIAVAKIPFDDITSGLALFDFLNPVSLPSNPSSNSGTTIPDPSPTPTPTAEITPITSLPGYPTPIVIHRDGYTSGYFLSFPSNDTAILALSSFTDANQTDPLAGPMQSQTVADFLTACLAANKSKLIIDLQGNGGGIVFQAYDIFSRLFPTLTPFGATRMRDTPAARYLGEVFTMSVGSGEVDGSLNSDFEAQAYVDLKNNTFADWNAVDPPETIYGDNFTAATRYNPGLVLNASIAATPQVFESQNIVMLYDGTCGSTCAVFSEFMKSQGGVRSVVMGGRSQSGPMQGVAGSKGTQAASSRFNFRNNMPSNSTSNTPLQFIYESSNCRLFYLKSDLYQIEGLWSRVRDVVWGNGSCVQGSTVRDGDKFPGNAGDTVEYERGVDSKVRLGGQPGLVGGSGRRNGTGTVSGEGERSRTMTVSGTKTGGGLSTAVAVNGTVYTAGFVAATSTRVSATVQGQASATGAGTANAAQFTNGAIDGARGEIGKLMRFVGVVALGMMV
ncbi:peptidase S41 family protein [Rutstroemia sp. NJR-2017a BVV2]|nr:peptidase S41 family protein [Rutstroemia sp. NJR-2017a BVV2]